MSLEGAIKRIKSGSFSLDGNMTEKQLKFLSEYMHDDFTSWEVSLGRGGSFAVEYPPEGVSSASNWKDSLEVILLPELTSLHPKILRRKIVTRFVPRLIDRESGISVSGTGTIPKEKGKVKEHWIRLPIIGPRGDLVSEQETLFTLMHEIAEIDFWQKSADIPHDWISLIRESARGDQLLRENRITEYNHLTDESIANLRAERAMRRKWHDYSMDG